MSVFNAFIDESGNDPNDYTFNMAGWVADVCAWPSFADEWQEVLRQNPTIEYFKHHEAKAQTSQFEGCSKAEANGKIYRLAQVIDRHIKPEKKHIGVVTGLRHEVLKRLIGKAVPSPRQVRSVLHVSRPYDFCFHSIMGLTLQYQLKVGQTEKVDFIFDEGDTAFSDCAALYREMRDRAMPPAISAIAGTVGTANDKTTPPLQAADLLAGQVMTSIRTGKPERPFQLLTHGNRILFSPIRWGEDPILTGFSNIVDMLNITWSIKMLDNVKRG